ncbi:MAG TPA: citrate lyase holo-[acyl-carrier protein] synthase [Bacillota bacterium]|nr:citrate lyase holo-[acyl-carrier protein] synthase [Bacillota bacterium]
MEKKMEKVLADREARWRLRLKEAALSRGCLITATLRIPFEYRTSRIFVRFMKKTCRFLCRELAMRKVCIDKKTWVMGNDGPALFLLVDKCPEYTKGLCVEFEEKTPYGKVLDLDIMDRNGMVVSREQLGLTARKCFICDNPAAVCSSRKMHSPEELAEALEKITGIRLCN